MKCNLQKILLVFLVKSLIVACVVTKNLEKPTSENTQIKNDSRMIIDNKENIQNIGEKLYSFIEKKSQIETTPVNI